MHGIPYYLVLRAGHESYVLERERVLIRRQASRMMNWFACACQTDVDRRRALDSFSREYGFSSDERKCLCSYSLVEGSETRHQLALLANL